MVSDKETDSVFLLFHSARKAGNVKSFVFFLHFIKFLFSIKQINTTKRIQYLFKSNFCIFTRINRTIVTKFQEEHNKKNKKIVLNDGCM